VLKVWEVQEIEVAGKPLGGLFEYMPEFIPAASPLPLVLAALQASNVAYNLELGCEGAKSYWRALDVCILPAPFHTRAWWIWSS